jgi:chromosome segregation ATPase
MSTGVSFWKRVGDVFRAGGAGGDNSNGNNGRIRSIDAADASSNGDPGESGPPPSEAAPRMTLLPWLRRQPGTPHLPETHQRLITLMDSMQEHFRKQDRQAEQLNSSVDRVANMLEQLAKAQRSAGERIHLIAQQVDVAGKHTASLSDALCQMPATMQAEAEAVRSVARQLEIAHEADTQLMHSLQQFGHAVDSLRQSGTAQVETLERLHAAERGQRETLTDLIRAQGRRFLLVMIVTAALGLGALVVLAVTLARVLGS